MILDYTDKAGYPRRVEIPYGDIDPTLGIPISVDWEALEFPEPLKLKLAHELFGRGLVSVHDFKQPQAIKQIFASLQAVLRIDATTIQNMLIGVNHGE